MKTARIMAAIVLVLAGAAALGAHYLAPAGYEQQFRMSPDAPPSTQHLLGTDDLGRDRMARLLYGTRVSLFLAPIAAGIATILAQFFGGLSGSFGGLVRRYAT